MREDVSTKCRVRGSELHRKRQNTRHALVELQLEKLFFIECAAAYPAKQKQAPILKLHHIVSIVTGPEHQGYPTLRTRALSAGLDREAYVWVGPDDDHIQEDFEEKFHKLLVLDAVVAGGPGIQALDRFDDITNNRWMRARIIKTN